MTAIAKWDEAQRLADRASNLLNSAAFNLQALEPTTSGGVYNARLTVETAKIEEALKVAKAAAKAYIESDRLYREEYV